LQPNWDHTPGGGYKGQVIVETNPELFLYIRNLVNYCKKGETNAKIEEKIFFIKAWNVNGQKEII
jgi:hypothetical protein